MAEPAERSFLARIRAALPALHPAERRLGEFLCEFPGELASYSAQELATLANVSKATVSRFVRRIGYPSYEAARRQARAEQRTGSRLFLASHESGGVEASLAANVAQGRENLDRTFGTIAQAEFDAAAAAILAARKVWVIGFRASHPFAVYLQWQLTQVVENIVAIPHGGETLGEHLVSFDAADVVVVVGLRRRVARMEQILAHAERAGARLLYITDEGVEPRAGAAWHFRCHTVATGPLFNHTSVMAGCHYLTMRAIELAGGPGRSRLRGIEMLNDAFDEL